MTLVATFPTRKTASADLADHLAQVPAWWTTHTFEGDATMSALTYDFDGYCIELTYLACPGGRWARRIYLCTNYGDRIHRHPWPTDTPIASAMGDEPMSLRDIVAVCGLDLREVA